MAIVSQGKPSRVKSQQVSCIVSGTEYTLYTCPANCAAEVSMLLLVGVTGTPSVKAFWNTGGDQVHILGGKNIAAGEFVLFTGATLVLQPGETLSVKGTSGSAIHLDAICTVTETFIPIG